MEKKERKKKYLKPKFEVFQIEMRPRILTGSGYADLTGAGVDESDADDNGLLVW